MNQAEITNQLIYGRANQLNYKIIQSHHLRKSTRVGYNSGINLREKVIL